MISFLFLFLGFIPLIYGAVLTVDGASVLARKLNLPDIVIGLTIIAFGTSSPELVVNLFASLKGNPDIAMGNVLGSNIFNILVILGISSVIFPLSVKSNTAWLEIPLCLLSSLAVLVAGGDLFFDKSEFSVVSRSDGIMLIFFFMIFIVYNLQLMKNDKFTEDINIKKYSTFTAAVAILSGFVLLAAGGNLLVNMAVKIAKNYGFSERIISLTIVSSGTSLPELATSVVAAFKRKVDLAVGNIVGSNIFNVFFILGISSVLHPVSVRSKSNFDMIVNILVSLLLFIFIFRGKGRKIDKIEGIVFILLYLIYMVIILKY